MLELAHAADWLASLAYAAPVLLVVVVLAIGSLRNRRRARRDHAQWSDRRREGGEGAS